jgi:hypothetical protein
MSDSVWESRAEMPAVYVLVCSAWLRGACSGSQATHVAVHFLQATDKCRMACIWCAICFGRVCEVGQVEGSTAGGTGAQQLSWWVLAVGAWWVHCVDAAHAGLLQTSWLQLESAIQQNKPRAACKHMHRPVFCFELVNEARHLTLGALLQQQCAEQGNGSQRRCGVCMLSVSCAMCMLWVIHMALLSLALQTSSCMAGSAFTLRCTLCFLGLILCDQLRYLYPLQLHAEQ